MTANGMMSFKTNNNPWEKGSKIGISRYTESSEKEATEAMLPTEKKPDCTRKRKKSEVRRSESFNDR